MVVRPATFLALAVLMAAAAGLGGWLAVRQADSDRAAVRAPAAPPAVVAAAAVDTAADDAEAHAAPAPAAARREPQARVAQPRAETPVPATTPATAPATTAAAAAAPEAPVTAAAADAAGGPPAAETLSATVQPAAYAVPVGAPRPRPAAAGALREAARERPRVEGWTRTPRLREAPRVDGWLRTTAAATDAPAPAPPDEFEVAADSVMGLQVEHAVSSDDAEVEHSVAARVTRDVLVGDQVAIPAGTRVRGSVVLVERAGKLRGQPRIGIRFHTLAMDGGDEVPIRTETIYREGARRGGESAQRIGGAAISGAILGAIFGGRRGAAIGSAAGAAGGTAMTLANDGPPARFPAGAQVTIRLADPVIVAAPRGSPARR